MQGLSKNHIKEATLSSQGRLGFTSTPNDKEDANTPSVLGKFIDAYNIDPANEVAL